MNEKDKNESYVRWQEFRINQLGFLNNLLLGLATGLIVIEVQLAFNEKVVFSDLDIWVVICSFLLLFVSAGIGIWIAWNRLTDFRKTAKVAKNRSNLSSQQLRDEVDKLGDRTWKLLKWQIVVFCLGTIGLAVLTIIHFLN